MKRIFFFILLLAITLTSCRKDNDMPYSGEYQRSLRVWHDFQTETGDSYVYRVDAVSWTGYSWQTTITVKQGKVIERSYVLKGPLSASSGGPITVVREWKEEEGQLGAHDEGAALLTLDEIYKKAKDEWLAERNNAKTYFETNNDGMISVCGYVPDACMDDCFNGIRIGYIRAL